MTSFSAAVRAFQFCKACRCSRLAGSNSGRDVRFSCETATPLSTDLSPNQPVRFASNHVVQVKPPTAVDGRGSDLSSTAGPEMVSVKASELFHYLSEPPLEVSHLLLGDRSESANANKAEGSSCIPCDVKSNEDELVKLIRSRIQSKAVLYGDWGCLRKMPAVIAAGEVNADLLARCEQFLQSNDWISLPTPSLVKLSGFLTDIFFALSKTSNPDFMTYQLLVQHQTTDILEVLAMHQDHTLDSTALFLIKTVMRFCAAAPDVVATFSARFWSDFTGLWSSVCSAREIQECTGVFFAMIDTVVPDISASKHYTFPGAPADILPSEKRDVQKICHGSVHQSALAKDLFQYVPCLAFTNLLEAMAARNILPTRAKISFVRHVGNLDLSSLPLEVVARMAVCLDSSLSVKSVQPYLSLLKLCVDIDRESLPLKAISSPWLHKFLHLAFQLAKFKEEPAVSREAQRVCNQIFKGLQNAINDDPHQRHHSCGSVWSLTQHFYQDMGLCLQSSMPTADYLVNLKMLDSKTRFGDARTPLDVLFLSKIVDATFPSVVTSALSQSEASLVARFFPAVADMSMKLKEERFRETFDICLSRLRSTTGWLAGYSISQLASVACACWSYHVEPSLISSCLSHLTTLVSSAHCNQLTEIAPITQLKKVLDKSDFTLWPLLSLHEGHNVGSEGSILEHSVELFTQHCMSLSVDLADQSAMTKALEAQLEDGTVQGALRLKLAALHHLRRQAEELAPEDVVAASSYIMKGLSADNSPVFHRLCVEYEQLVDMLSAPQYMLETWGGAFISLLQCGLKLSPLHHKIGRIVQCSFTIGHVDYWTVLSKIVAMDECPMTFFLVLVYSAIGSSILLERPVVAPPQVVWQRVLPWLLNIRWESHDVATLFQWHVQEFLACAPLYEETFVLDTCVFAITRYRALGLGPDEVRPIAKYMLTLPSSTFSRLSMDSYMSIFLSEQWQPLLEDKDSLEKLSKFVSSNLYVALSRDYCKLQLNNDVMSFKLRQGSTKFFQFLLVASRLLAAHSLCGAPVTVPYAINFPGESVEEFVLEARPSILPVRALLQVALAGLLDDAALLHHRQLFLLDTALECLQSPEVFCDVDTETWTSDPGAVCSLRAFRLAAQYHISNLKSGSSVEGEHQTGGQHQSLARAEENVATLLAAIEHNSQPSLVLHQHIAASLLSDFFFGEQFAQSLNKARYIPQVDALTALDVDGVPLRMAGSGDDAKSSDLADFTWPPGTHYRIAWFISRGSAEYSPNGEDLLMNAVLREATCKWLKQRNILHVEVPFDLVSDAIQRPEEFDRLSPLAAGQREVLRKLVKAAIESESIRPAIVSM